MKNAMQLKAIMKKLAKENQISAQLVLQNYMLERFLERVSLSPYRDNYIIKGGFLISSMVGLNSRATMDMDATIKGYPVTQDTVQKMIEKILTVPVDDDITFTFKSIGEIREGDEYTGYRVALTADFPPMAVPLKLDITTGDKITPREIQYDYKLMLEDQSRLKKRKSLFPRRPSAGKCSKSSVSGKRPPQPNHQHRKPLCRHRPHRHRRLTKPKCSST